MWLYSQNSILARVLFPISLKLGDLSQRKLSIIDFQKYLQPSTSTKKGL